MNPELVTNMESLFVRFTADSKLILLLMPNINIAYCTSQTHQKRVTKLKQTSFLDFSSFTHVID